MCRQEHVPINITCIKYNSKMECGGVVFTVIVIIVLVLWVCWIGHYLIVHYHIMFHPAFPFAFVNYYQYFLNVLPLIHYLSITTVELTFLARPIKKITEVLDLEQNTAYGMIHKQGNASLELTYDSLLC